MLEHELFQRILNILNTEYHNYNKAHEISVLLNYTEGYIYILQYIEYVYKKGIDNNKLAEELIDKFYMTPKSKL